MATLEFSAVFNSGSGRMNSAFIGPTSATVVNTFSSNPTASSLMPAYNAGANQGIMYFHIMKGTVPTDPDTLTSFSARSADVLITWQRSNASGAGSSGLINGTASNQFSLSTETATPMSLTTSFQAASGAGTATWFWWTTRASSNTTGSATDVVYHSIIGTVGTVGSGSDLEIGNTTITSGKLYRMINFRIALPTTVTY